MFNTRRSETFTISLPKDLATEVDRLARSERRSRSELVREAFRQYVQRQARWASIFSYGEQAGRAAGVRSEQEANRIAKQERRRST